MPALKRFLTIVIAYLLTVFVAALGASVAIAITTLSQSESLAIFAIFGFACLIMGLFATIPSAVLVMIAEHFAIRSLWYYGVVAVVTGLVLARIFANQTWMYFVTAGLGVACGAVFWAVAGRNAGVLKTPENGRAQIRLLLLLAAAIVAQAVFLLLFMR